MSKLEELIAELCPDGVEYKKLKEVAQISAGGDLPRNYAKGQKVATEQYPYPIYSNGTEGGALYGFTDSYKIEKEAVTVSARGTIGYHEVRAGKFTPIVRLITLIADESKITTKFLHYALYIAGIEGVTTGIPSLTVPMLGKFTIPIPPLPVQNEIVRILDNFTELTAELKTQLAARKKQYEYYRNRLLTFKNSTPRIRLGDICTVITKGTTPKNYHSSGIAFIKTEAFDGSRIDLGKLSYVNEETHFGFLKRSILQADDILITIAGATIGKCALVPKNILPANTNQALAIIRLAEGNSKKYVLYLLQSNHMKEYMQSNIKGSAQPNLNLKQLNDFIIPLPSIEEQQRIVAILDRFDTLCNDISTGLPAEIAARTKQYEYYRDKLLTFPERA